MELDYLKELLKLLILIAMALGVAIPQTASNLLNPPVIIDIPPPTPTQEINPNFAIFTPNSIRNIRSDCRISASVIRQSNQAIAVDKTIINADGYSWVRVLDGGCVAVRYGNQIYGVIQ